MHNLIKLKEIQLSVTTFYGALLVSYQMGAWTVIIVVESTKSDSKQKLKLACGSFSEQFSPFNLQTPLKLNTSKLTQSLVNFALVRYVSRAVYF